MDENQAKKLLDETFNNNFDINRYSIFIKELFNRFDISPKSWQVWTEYRGYIDSYQLLGSFKDESKKTIDEFVKIEDFVEALKIFIKNCLKLELIER